MVLAALLGLAVAATLASLQGSPGAHHVFADDGKGGTYYTN
jgi:hypothetical protein